MQDWPPVLNFAHLLGGRWAVSEPVRHHGFPLKGMTHHP